MNHLRRRPAPWDPLRAALAVLAYVPVLFASPGRVSADTKTYLYLDPGRLLAKAPWLWDASTGLGTVSHQTIGYLFPMGPWFWLTSAVGLPDWLAQRLWLGTVFFAAGAGVVALARQLRLPWRAAAVAAVAYQLSPYVLSYVARLSVILLPWAGLGWLMTFTHRALRERSWRWPAAVALVVLTVGGVNATALVLAGLGPLCLAAWSVWSDRALSPRHAAGAVARIGVLSVAVSLWWMAGLWAQSGYGIPILRYTETYEAVARAASPVEVLRGLGYWFGYGRDAVSPWVDPVGAYTHDPALVLVSLAVPALALAALALTRWRARGLAVLLVVVGTVVSVGAHPFASPSLAGRGLRAVIGSGVGGALRSTPRAVPLVALGLGLGLGMGVDILARRRPGLRWAAPAAAVALLAVNLPSLWTGHVYTSSLLRDEAVPAWWTDAAAALDRGDPAYRALEVPGSDFASYRWGGTVDPVLAGLTTRDLAARELVPWGSAASADLLAALDRRWQDRLAEPAAVAPLLRRLGVHEVVARNDLQYERYRLARPRTLAGELAATPGLTAGPAFGPPTPNLPPVTRPLVDAEELTTPAAAPDPAPVALYSVTAPRPVLRAEPDRTTIVAGDGEGLVDVAAAGGLDAPGVVRYAAELAARPDELRADLAAGAAVVVTDTNRRQARRWGSVREYLGATETATEVPLRADPTDRRLDLFPGAGPSSFTTTELRGVARVQATAYGNPITYTPEDRAVMAVDGDPRTAWRVAAFAEPRGERLEVQLSGPTTTDHVTLLQPQDGEPNRWITGVRLRFDGGSPLDVALDDSSRAQPGQRVEIGRRTFTTLSIEITATNYTRLPGYRGISAVGFAEVDIAGARATELVRVPQDVLGAVTDQDLSLVLTRQRASALETTRGDPEPALRRVLTLPVARTFTLTGTGAVSPRADDAVVVPLLAPSGPTVTASARLAGDPAGTGLAALDGSAATEWQTPIDHPLQQLRIVSASPATVDRMTLQVVADGRHSVPTRLRIGAPGADPVDVDVPPVADGAPGTVLTVPLVLSRPVTGTELTVAVAAVREVRSIDPDSGASVVLPVGIAELGLPGLVARPLGRTDGPCRDDLVRVDGAGVPVRVQRTGTSLAVTACGALRLDAGEHVIETAPGASTGLDVDRLVAHSAATAATGPAAPARPAGVALAAARTTPVSYRVAVSGATGGPFWLVLGQSLNAGWHASVDGRDLGPPTLVDGYANGWLVQPREAAFTVELRWTPQRVVWGALVASGLGVLVCVGLLLLGRRGDLVARRHAAAAALGNGPVASASAAAPVAPGRALPAASALAVAGALVCSGWSAALIVLVVRVAVWRVPRRFTRWAHAAPGALLAGVAAFVVAKQVRYHLPADLDWPQAFDAVQPLAWAAVFLVVPTYRPGRRPPPPAAVDDASSPAGQPAGAPSGPPPSGPPPSGPHPRSWPPGLRPPGADDG